MKHRKFECQVNCCAVFSIVIGNDPETGKEYRKYFVALCTNDGKPCTVSAASDFIRVSTEFWDDKDTAIIFASGYSAAVNDRLLGHQFNAFQSEHVEWN